MLNLIKAEILKQKRLFAAKLIWLGPVLTILLAIALMAGSHLQDGSYNWWYTLLLPGTFTMFAALNVSREKSKNRHGMFSIMPHKKKLWIAQIAVGVLFLFGTCLVFFLAATAGGFLFGSTISLGRSACASLLLFITFAWQIPLWMAVSEKTGAFAAVILSLVCNFIIAVVCAVKDSWWIPFSIPARLMCPAIGVLPNGLMAEAGDPLTGNEVILPGILITVVLFAVLSAVTALRFEKREVWG